MVNENNLYSYASYIAAVIIHIAVLLFVPGLKTIVDIKPEEKKPLLIEARMVKIVEEVKKEEKIIKPEVAKEKTKIESQEKGKNIRQIAPPKLSIKNELSKEIKNVSNVPSIDTVSIAPVRSSDINMPIPVTTYNPDVKEKEKFINDREIVGNMDINAKNITNEKESFPVIFDDKDAKKDEKVVLTVGKESSGGASFFSDTPDGVSTPEVIGGKGDAKWISGNMPPYPQKAKNNGWQGDVVVILNVDESSKVRDVFVSQKSGYGILDETTKQAAYNWKILITDSGMKIKGSVRVTVKFRLK